MLKLRSHTLYTQTERNQQERKAFFAELQQVEEAETDTFLAEEEQLDVAKVDVEEASVEFMKIDHVGDNFNDSVLIECRLGYNFNDFSYQLACQLRCLYDGADIWGLAGS